METYNGHVKTPTDAIILFEACRIGLLPRVQRRLSEKERQSIKSGSVFVWDEREAGMRRWTDGKSWSASRVSGSFLTYREMEGKRGGSTVDKNANRDGVQGEGAESDGGPDGYRYKPNGLMKQSFSIITNNGQHLHLISYYARPGPSTSSLMQPSNDVQLRHIRPEKGMYPESTIHEQSSIPAVTRGPMNSPGYTHSPNQPSPYARQSPYAYGHPSWAPPSPMHTPPPHPHYSPYYQHPHGPYPGQSPLQQMQYPPPTSAYAQASMTAYDRPPPPMSSSGLPPPPPQQYSQPPQPNGHPGPYQGYAPAYPQYQAPPLQAPGYPPLQPYLYEQRPPTEAAPPATRDGERAVDDRQDSHHNFQNEPPQASASGDPQAQPGATPTSATSGPTIPSISAMLNGRESAQPPQRTGSRSPPSASEPRPLQDIPSHKLGFEANRDVQALRNLDKSTFKY